MKGPRASARGPLFCVGNDTIKCGRHSVRSLQGPGRAVAHSPAAAHRPIPVHPKTGEAPLMRRLSVSKKPRRVRRPRAAKSVKSCSAAACTWQKILFALQVWNLSAAGRQNLGPSRKPSEAVCVGRGNARERTEVSPSGGTGAERTLRRRARGRVQPFRKSGRGHFFDSPWRGAA